MKDKRFESLYDTLVRINIRAAIMFGLFMIIFLLFYIFFIK